MTHNLEYLWKEFHIHIPSLDSWMRSSSKEYVGCSAGSSLVLHFVKEPSQQTKDRIQMYMDALTADGEKAIKNVDKKREEAYKIAQTAILSMMWDGMIPAERKIVMNQQLTKDDLDELVKKHIRQE